MNLTTHILTKNNEKTLAKCLDSIIPLESNIIVADLGSSDSTLEILNEYKIKHVKIDFVNDYSKIRNDLVESTTTEWQFYIDPWETLDNGHEQLLWSITQPNTSYNVYNVQGELIIKQTRLWKKTAGKKFTRPIYESIEFDDSKLIECVISGTSTMPNEEIMNILLKWKSQQPHASDTEYYMACCYLSSGRYDEFLNHAERFLFTTSKPSVASVLTNYYMASIKLYKKNTADCVKHLIYCLYQEPTLAEFWCLLGDCFVRMNQYHRAVAFYDNAIIFGSRRLNNDNYPVEVKKYEEYPNKMLDHCREIIKKIHNLH